MSVIATFHIEADSFVLGEPLELDAIERIEFERVIPSQKTILPYFWAWGTAFDEFESRVREEPGVERLECVTTLEDARLYYVEWNNYLPGLLEAVRQADAVVVEGYGATADDGEAIWQFEFRFPAHEALSELHEHCREYDLTFELAELREVDDAAAKTYGLTAKQRETLVAALERGYFDQPRSYSLAELADDFDVTEAAISGRLRRAQKTLLEAVLESG